MAANDTSQKMDSGKKKKSQTSHSKSNHSKKDAETKRMQNYMPFNKGFWEFEDIYKSVQHKVPRKKVGNYLIDCNPNSYTMHAWSWARFNKFFLQHYQLQNYAHPPAINMQRAQHAMPYQPKQKIATDCFLYGKTITPQTKIQMKFLFTVSSLSKINNTSFWILGGNINVTQIQGTTKMLKCHMNRTKWSETPMQNCHLCRWPWWHSKTSLMPNAVSVATNC